MPALPVAALEAKTEALVGEPRLIALAKAGDEAAARTLIQSNNRRIYRVARSILRDDSEAEDVVQETYLRAYRGMHHVTDVVCGLLLGVLAVVAALFVSRVVDLVVEKVAADRRGAR